MAQVIGNYHVFSSNASKKNGQMANVTVRNSAGEIVARLYSERSQPLKWLRRWPHSQERLELVAQLRKSGVEREMIEKIVSL